MRIGIFGGAFDPPHLGHISLILNVSQELQFDRTLIIPTGTSPHKSLQTPFTHRLKMAKLSFVLETGFYVSNIEKRPGTSYTIDTILKLKKKYPNDEFFLVIGGDMLAYFDKWHEYKRILELCTVVAAAREDNYEELQTYADKLGITLLNLPILPLSSSEIRKKLTKGEDVGNLLRKKVSEYIGRKKLYQ